MQYKPLGNTGMNVSRVVYGGIVSAGEIDTIVCKDVDQAASDRFVAYALERGVNYFDVAPSYGNAEEQLGRSLEGHRNDVYLACKTLCRDRKSAEEEMKTSRKLLKTDYFDTYQLHAINGMDDVEQAFAKGGVMELLDEMKRAGIARHIGFTAHNEDAALEMLRRYPFETVLFPINWLLHMKTGMGSRLAKVAKERGIGLLGMKFMIDRAWDSREERFSSRYPKSWCKPLDPEDGELIVAAMRYALSVGADVLDPPGNFESFSFALEHADEVFSEELTARDKELLDARFLQNEDKLFF